VFPPKRTLSIWLLVFVCGLLVSGRLSAQIEQFSTPLGEKVRISLAPGWGLYSMNDLNKHYIDRFAKVAGIFEDNIDNGPTIYGEVSYVVTPNISASLGVNYLRGQLEEKSWENVVVEGEGTLAMRWERSLTTTALAPQLMVKYHFPLGDLDLFSGAGLAWCWGKSILKSDSRIPDLSTSFITEDRFKAQGAGLLGCIGMSHDLSDKFAIGTEIGYRHFVTGDLETEGGTPWVVEYNGTSHKIKLDFSGAFLLVTLSLRL